MKYILVVYVSRQHYKEDEGFSCVCRQIRGESLGFTVLLGKKLIILTYCRINLICLIMLAGGRRII
jgi:hypothetical protein